MPRKGSFDAQGRAGFVPQRPNSSAVWFAKRLQDEPDKGHSCYAEDDSAAVVKHIVELDGVVAEKISARATDRGDEVLPQMIPSNALRALQEKYNQPRKDDYGSPVVRRFHALVPDVRILLTTVRVEAATILRPFPMHLHQLNAYGASLHHPIGSAT